MKINFIEETRARAVSRVLRVFYIVFGDERARARALVISTIQLRSAAERKMFGTAINIFRAYSPRPAASDRVLLSLRYRRFCAM